MRIAVMGGGSIGRRHIRNLKALGRSDLVVYDPDSSVCRAIAAEEQIPAYTSLDALWELQPQVALIASPTQTHLDLSLSSARHGCHLFIEKPLSHSLDGVDNFAAEVARRKLVTMVACNMRFDPGPALVKDLIAKEAAGAVISARIQTGSYLPRWRPWQDYRKSYSSSTVWGGAILDCIHEIDLAIWYFGPARVIGAAHIPATAIGLETDGLAEIILRHDPGILCSVHLNFVQRDYCRTCQIIGSEGTLYWDFKEREVRLHGSDGELKHAYPEPDGWQMNQMYLDELKHFLGAVEANFQTVNPVQGGIEALKVALAARSFGLEEHA